ncbi:bifunctional 4-hydroxy-2-oxoglutarate aldolase/2-dehydro-3-deoxy-phosphogluconate aldolase [Anaerobacillus alkaliphilus]|uniref:Bifunctional 4-hydroxy-2-oxoglutarate aldolase/2-dehydro-3-deoxy-phosphogluconate aldolase n=1 Tax=Anaerobacillus alkaliphilus TaxID=1548597 RepID=A0A4Q0VUL5_9BACI|nr:bifunctional 4-hydroxy-2-oxoglutarate aldolase/2-dehydro-3-deoxy-phosphogluconate aldolase [Anaerobacillus alkaliphilus]RXJ02067.1 bifunctional 4-hydroxy-2-oxoglutarate aldolase/2-dehydro-3-deoxy-phosphogluconate aldolase [Anaerobacillus alkaliphilus]
MNLIKQIKDSGIVAVIRGANKDNIIPIAKALSKGGVTALELTVETPKILSLVEMVADELKDEAIVGVGTVLDPETARAAIMAGARFVFSPVVNVETIKMTKRYGVLSVPGALTPTEILTAYEHGADIIKVFPANIMGPGYFKDVRGPLPHIPMMPTGGIDLTNVGSYIKAGAVAAGVGSTLVNTKETIDEEYCAKLTERAQQFVNEVRLARGNK